MIFDSVVLCSLWCLFFRGLVSLLVVWVRFLVEGCDVVLMGGVVDVGFSLNVVLVLVVSMRFMIFVVIFCIGGFYFGR